MMALNAGSYGCKTIIANANKSVVQRATVLAAISTGRCNTGVKYHYSNGAPLTNFT